MLTDTSVSVAAVQLNMGLLLASDPIVVLQVAGLLLTRDITEWPLWDAKQQPYSSYTTYYC